MSAVSIEISSRRTGALHDNWPRVACDLLEGSEAALVRVLIGEALGSTPREPGTNMLVLRDATLGTIGGGNLEWQALRSARALLACASAAPQVQLIRAVLGPDLGQCCGGIVHLWLERLTRDDLPRLRELARVACSGNAAIVATELCESRIARRMLARGSGEWQRACAELHEKDCKLLDPGTPAAIQLGTVPGADAILLERIEVRRAALWLYGAGHVGQALVRILEDLPFEITWIDSRKELLPASSPHSVRTLYTSTPGSTVGLAPAGVRFLVMTHDHALDYLVCREVLRRGDFGWLGLIGSKSKGARFRSRLKREGTPPDCVAKLVCPIGVEGIASKSPAAIAVAIAAQLLQGLESRSTPAEDSPPLAAGTVPGECPPDCARCRPTAT